MIHTESEEGGRHAHAAAHERRRQQQRRRDCPAGVQGSLAALLLVRIPSTSCKAVKMLTLAIFSLHDISQHMCCRLKALSKDTKFLHI